MVAAGSLLVMVTTPGSSATKVVSIMVILPMKTVLSIFGPFPLSDTSWSLRVTRTTERAPD